jgi:hypothetical protein
MKASLERELIGGRLTYAPTASNPGGRQKFFFDTQPETDNAFCAIV